MEQAQAMTKFELVHLAGMNLDSIGKVIWIKGVRGTHVTNLSAPIQSCAFNLSTGEIRLCLPANTCIGVTESFRFGHLPESPSVTINNWKPVSAILWSKVTGWQIKFDDNTVAAIEVTDFNLN